MANHHGDFIWYELMTSDADAARDFYGGLMGWSFRTEHAGGMDYTVFSRDGGPEAGGLMELTEEMWAGGARPLWAGYVAVEDVDVAARAVRDGGGAVLMEPFDIEGVGRIAFVTDPAGAPFYVMRGASEEPSRAFAQDGPMEGHCAWNELNTSGPEAALDFYGGLFGWEVAESMDMGPMGTYRLLRNRPHETMLGAVAPAGKGARSLWSFYFRVPDIDAAIARVGETGGTVAGEAEELPGGEFVAAGTDPQGAAFALIGRRAA